MILFIGVAGNAYATSKSGVKLNKTNVALAVRKTVKLKVKGTSGKVKWTSSNKKVATVSSKGAVKGKKIGTATITAKVNGKKVKCKVKVVTANYARCISLLESKKWFANTDVYKNAYFKFDGIYCYCIFKGSGKVNYKDKIRSVTRNGSTYRMRMKSGYSYRIKIENKKIASIEYLNRDDKFLMHLVRYDDYPFAV
jgi:hypothetical protein